MIMSIFQVALGGAVGAVLRYLTGVGAVRLWGETPFPMAVLGINILGSFLMGAFVVAAAEREMTHLSPLVMAGLLGGFTTFSAFSLEAVTLYERGAVSLAAIYILASVTLSILGLIAGMALARGVLA